MFRVAVLVDAAEAGAEVGLEAVPHPDLSHLARIPGPGAALEAIRTHLVADQPTDRDQGHSRVPVTIAEVLEQTNTGVISNGGPVDAHVLSLRGGLLL